MFKNYAESCRTKEHAFHFGAVQIRSETALGSSIPDLFIALLVFGHVTSNPVLKKNDRLLISEQSFSRKLQEPCSAYDFLGGQIAFVDMLRLEQEFVSTLEDKARDMFTSIGDCANLTSIPDPLYYIPGVEQLKNLTFSRALQVLDELIVNYTAHVYFSKSQEENISCYRSYQAQEVVVNLEQVRCYLLHVDQIRGQIIDANSSARKILNTNMIDLAVCSLRFSRDCYIFKDVTTLAEILNGYLDSQISLNEDGTTPT
ncbi:uncharacterized protein LOC111088723 [Limulus polyphemus]|uniref:Uncharacterized protein LOC111088723 n=1 Tax=Limulus polyphemus TaxID=6850 RepID=A0ABM1THD3_LIMPO|nr:uncharacterized protein LOC111088723 [Limulus polyphemus]